MNEQRDLLARLRVASPCRVGWETMTGDERVRFCQACSLHVYNFSEMTADEVRALISRAEERVCGRLYRRADGTVITRDCPVGLRAVRRRMARAATASLAAIISLFSVVAGRPKTAKLKQCTPAQSPTIERTQTSSSSSLQGRVLDANGAVVAGALVTLKDEQTGATQVATSNDVGAFSFDAPPGNYTFTVAASGFTELMMTGIHVNANEVAHTDIVMRVDSTWALSGIISIAEPPVSNSSEIKTTFTQKQITSLPIR